MFWSKLSTRVGFDSPTPLPCSPFARSPERSERSNCNNGPRDRFMTNAAAQPEAG